MFLTTAGLPGLTARTIVISGLPASGKSMLAVALAQALSLALIDKDALLEALFERVGVGDTAWRRKLSEQADQEFRSRAEQAKGAVLCTWWKHPLSTRDSGTSTQWLSDLPGACVEVHCKCSPGVAVQRFVGRARHPGHLDQRWSSADLSTSFERQALLGPLGVGSVIEVCTEGSVDIGALSSSIADAFAAAGRQQQA